MGDWGSDKNRSIFKWPLILTDFNQFSCMLQYLHTTEIPCKPCWEGHLKQTQKAVVMWGKNCVLKRSVLTCMWMQDSFILPPVLQGDWVLSELQPCCELTWTILWANLFQHHCCSTVRSTCLFRDSVHWYIATLSILGGNSRSWQLAQVYKARPVHSLRWCRWPSQVEKWLTTSLR